MMALISLVFSRYAGAAAPAGGRRRIGWFSRWRRRRAARAAFWPENPEKGPARVKMTLDEAVFIEFQLRQLHF
jgi:hypothetical protein